MAEPPNVKRPSRAEQTTGLSWRQAMIVAGLAMSLPGLLFAPPLLGYWLDQWLGTQPYLALTFAGVGLFGAAVDIMLILRRTGMAE